MGLPWKTMDLLVRLLLGDALLDPPLPPALINRISPRCVLTTTQPTLVLRHVYERARRAAVQNGEGQRRPRRTRTALKPLKPQVSIRDYLGPQTAVSKSSGHVSTCGSQGKVRLPPLPSPIPSIEIYLKARIANARSYNNALSFTSLAAHIDQTRLGTLGPPVFRVFGRLYYRLGPAVNQRPATAQTRLIEPAEATDTRLGPDGADTRRQRSTLIKLESMLHTVGASVSARW
ncbi:BZ3500_MvSof-1268-A1-R1_Chr3-1g06094 [Microbotryum saponariae]|uniref:BZ3500_MvSof-1268-A1-R1_Chr3-1g06094 protein n=1 Tax=Microbotryum saponariae TaxID=289078 RepID=A0A2X0LT87_9BASI|nr:BZ3500_MvSof-1268-A1-R1_Chr3-1g06094 [Microbotryum saponariae]SDA03954.1 BZ3501_MvSof-1269-A2-R1_Chr3-2g05779 [Microbotryum saponariae]